jgi:1,2-diacylglycerol 3-beta-galactosyltransferase
MIYLEFQAGPGTIAEAMIRGLPIILNGYIAGQVFSLAPIIGSA